MPSDLQHILTHKLLRDMAGFRAFRDGHEYFERGQVYGLAQDQTSVAAKVLGLYEYQTRLWVEDNQLLHTCTCPVGQGEGLCKHGVAVGLMWLSEHDSGDPGSGASPAGEDPFKTITVYLSTQERSGLIDLIQDRAREDHRFYTWLLFRTTRLRDRTLDQKRFRRYIDVILTKGMNTASCAEALDQVVQALTDLIDENMATEAYTLAEYTIARIQDMAGPVDEDDVAISACLDRLQNAYLHACRIVRPNAADLAGKLLEWRLNQRWDMFRDALATYADVLSAEGQAAYHARAAQLWEQEPDLGPGDPVPERYGRRFRLAYIVEAATIHTGDIEAQVSARKKDLTQPSSFLGIAELYHEAGDADQALSWAERGLASFSGRPDPRLRDFLIHEYQRRGRHEDAAKLLRR